jgi:hypothetical protein
VDAGLAVICAHRGERPPIPASFGDLQRVEVQYPPLDLPTDDRPFLYLSKRTPRDTILAQPFGVRLAWSLLVVPLPIFFAGLVFSTTFREAADPAIAFGSNLIGATIGGFCEYLGMAIGSNALSLIVMGAYLASFACVRLVRRQPAEAPATALSA